MLKQTEHFHGSDLEKIEKYYGIPKERIVSFSANVNPLGLSDTVKAQLARQLDVITAYPDREYRQLRETISAYCGSPASHIFVGNGSTELISLLIQLLQPKKALILGPTYSEYEREVALAGGRAVYFPLSAEENFLLEESRLTDQLYRTAPNLLILCNPNNPTASVITSGQLAHILKVCRETDTFVLVDETYVEFAPVPEQVTAVPFTGFYDNLAVLRGVSKFFAAPGLRLGYAVTGNAALLQEAVQKQNPWTVSSIAEAAGRLLFSDTAHIQKTKALIDTQRLHILQALSALDGIRAYPSYCNFVLVHLLKEGLTSDNLFDMAIRKGLMIRNCSSFPYLDNTWFRFCFMLPEDNEKLLACIREFLSCETSVQPSK